MLDKKILDRYALNKSHVEALFSELEKIAIRQTVRKAKPEKYWGWVKNLAQRKKQRRASLNPGKGLVPSFDVLKTPASPKTSMTAFLKKRGLRI